VGRLTLIKSALQVFPTYVMQSAHLYVSIYDEVDKKCKRFLWGDTENQRRIHTMAWRNLFKPKNVGELGLRMAKDVNRAFIMKCGWELCTKRDFLWVQIICSKYDYGESIFPHIDQNRTRSNLWKGICNN